MAVSQKQNVLSSIPSPLSSSSSSVSLSVSAMKSSGTSFLERFLSNTKRQRCFNIGNAVPFLLTCFFVAFIFSFFLLYSPNPLSLIPDQPILLPPHKQHQRASTDQLASPKPNFKQKRCDLFKGKWVRAPRESSYYTNWSCSSIPEFINCFKQGREDRDFLNWKWKPDECELQSFNPKTFLHIVRGKKWAFIGDSVARNHMDSFVCLLSQNEKEKKKRLQLECDSHVHGYSTTDMDAEEEEELRTSWHVIHFGILLGVD
ncbi:hypothetical protein K1719_035452 [Acacia pycnantha]|nr:hypothetical protein K1719_039964 [Acacia pycnantha]KAI9082583.1 hypothetical protein K1719_035452 [Acacia pycnantha]